MNDPDLDEGLVDTLDEPDTAADVGGEPSCGDEPANHFPTMYAFVEEYLVHIYAHEIRNQIPEPRWCATWWEHPEAVARVEALWKAFEVLRLDAGTGMSVWFRDHADPCMTVLLGASGPFEGCSDQSHKVRTPLPVTTAPEWLRNNHGSTAS